MIVTNDVRSNICPLCKSEKILLSGRIDYRKPTQFSTTDISLKMPPELWKCENCKSWFTQNIIPEEDATRLYAMGKAGDRWSANGLRESKSEGIIRTLDIIFQKNKTVLDVGCNTGELLDFAKSQGCRTFGVELSDTSRDILMEKGHVAFHSLDEATDSYDIITAFDLVEHLYNFPSFLEACSRKLTKNGLFVILTGDISSLSAHITGSNWWYLKYPEHILFISQKYIKSFSNFQIVHLVHTYASVGYEHSFADTCKRFVMEWLKGNYQGLPSLGPDHILMVLKK